MVRIRIREKGPDRRKRPPELSSSPQDAAPGGAYPRVTRGSLVIVVLLVLAILRAIPAADGTEPEPPRRPISYSREIA